MNYLYKALFLIIASIFISGCTGKHLTVKSLHPSVMHDKKIQNIILESFLDDNINQANYIEEKLVNASVDGIRIFNLKNTYDNIDAIVTGEIMESSLYYDTYYDEQTDYSRCWNYEYKNGKRTNKCLKYKERRIPCENRTYKVKTKVQVLDRNEYLLFSKIYTKSKNTRKCFNDRYFYNYNPIYYGHINIDRKKHQINSNLARQIANSLISDISPHYTYQNITIIENLDKNPTLYDETIKKEYKDIIELLDNGNINISQSMLHKLNIKLQRQSYEVLYNLALTYEAKNQLSKAKSYYEEAKYICKNIDNLKIIDIAINRVQKHLEDKIKAKSQLAY